MHAPDDFWRLRADQNSRVSLALPWCYRTDELDSVNLEAEDHVVGFGGYAESRGS